MRPIPPGESSGPARQREIFLDGVAGRRPLVPVDAARLEACARAAMSAEAFAYVAGGAGAERTMAAERVPMIFSSQASVPMEQCAAAMRDAPRWFQLYWSRSDDLVRSFVRRAEACGCSAIVLTLDTTLLGWRPRDLDLGYLPFLHGKGIAQYTSDPVFRASLREPLGGEATKTRVTASSLRVFASMVRRYPGRLSAKLRTGDPRGAVQRRDGSPSCSTVASAPVPMSSRRSPSERPLPASVAPGSTASR